MKEDVVAANLANLRQSINELKECVNRQNVTPNQPEQHIKVDLDEKTIYNGVATYSGAYPFTFRQLIRV